ncbi:uroporphyrinogen-III synthase [Candidatus Berkiella aquae]|nr:uroporphyrinogen-III synthase [Candidatus Berkiella aquae]MCS5712699.1 uroporphyrinogen-III synthase [Candidatus Berkiella aquae]
MRPAHQVQPLADAIQQMGASTILLPTLSIVPLLPSLSLQTSWINQIREADWVMISSQNGVHCAPPLLLQALALTKTCKVVTMGAATTRALVAKGVSVFFTSPPGADSEQLLTEPFFQENEIANKKIMLIAGEGGRTLIADTLTARGALVTWMKVYRQEKPKLALKPLLADWASLNHPFCFMVTSLNCLHHFLDNVSIEHYAWINQQAFIVVSERIAQAARKWGIQHTFVAKSAEKEQLCTALLHVSQFCHTMT